MTETEWLTATDPAPMLEYVRDVESDRKFRLFACGCCRLRWALLTDDRSRRVVETVELFVDGQASERELRQARESAQEVTLRLDALAHRALEESRGKWRHFVTTAYERAGAAEAAHLTAWDSPHIYPYPWETDCGGGPYDAASIGLSRDGYDRVFREHGDICRCIFGNPFRPVPYCPEWRTSTVLALAEGIYEERAYDRLPILADALEDAGCDSGDILEHCRGDGPHVRGCWVVDLVLGKE